MTTTILYVFDNKFSIERRLRGILSAAREKNWIVERIEASHNRVPLDEMIRFWNADGAIVEGGLENSTPYTPAQFARQHLPVVYCDDSEREFRGPRTSVRNDSGEITAIATRALVELDLPHYAYVGYHQPRDWSTERQKIFLSVLRKLGKQASFLDPCRSRPCTCMTEFDRRLSTFLLGLPRPCGILAANDEIGRHVLHAALRLGIIVPDEMPVIGIDNDALTCENTCPTLASIAPDFETAGRRAVELLAERIADPNRPFRTLTYGTTRLHHRQSLRKFVRKDTQLVKSVEFIRLNACSKIRVDDIVATTELSRRTFELRFQALTGHSVQDEIEDIRLRTAMDLLTSTRASVDSIAQRCGYSGASSLLHLFAKHLNTTPAEWRKGEKH